MDSFAKNVLNSPVRRHFGLPYVEALTKALEVVKRDTELVQIVGAEFDTKVQLDNLLGTYLVFDADATLKKIISLEGNDGVLIDEIRFLIKTFLGLEQNLHHNLQQCVNIFNMFRFEHLLEKYLLKGFSTVTENGPSLLPIRISFPQEEYNIKRDSPSLCFPLPDAMKNYNNFKREYNVDCIFGLLPSGNKYGGFVKAFLNLKITGSEIMVLGTDDFQVIFSAYRSYFNSSIFANDKRVEFFEKLDIKENDLSLWSQLFDKQYPGYKNIHKFFGQVA